MTKKRFAKLLMSMGYSRDKARREAARVKEYRGSVSYSQRYKTLYALSVCTNTISNLAKSMRAAEKVFYSMKSEMVDFCERLQCGRTINERRL